MSNVIEAFEKAFATDDAMSYERKGEKLLELYKECDTEQQYVLNQMFIHLCGYSLETLIKKGGNLNG